MTKKIVYPQWISKKMRLRFDILEFCVDCDGFLYSPKVFDNKWDFQTKALYYRSIDMRPDRIAEILGLNVNTLKNREFLGLITLDYDGKNYELRDTSRFDWSTVGYVDENQQRFIYFGGTQDVQHHGTFKDDGGLDTKISPQLCMDGELLQYLHDCKDVLDKPKEPKDSNPSEDLYKKYYGDYKD